jgi:Patatin-like phospholipase
MIARARNTPGIGDPGLFLPRLQRSIVLSPLILIGSLSLLLPSTGQFQEALLRVVEPENTRCGWHLSLGFVAFLLLSVTLFYSYLTSCVVLRRMGIGYGSSLIYDSKLELDRDRSIVWIRDVAALTCAAAPLLTVGYTFWTLAGDARSKAGLVALPIRLCAVDTSQIPAQLVHIAFGWFALSAIFLLALFLQSRLELRRGWIAFRRTRTRVPPLLTWIGATMLLLPIPLINFHAVWQVRLFQEIGPLATFGLVLMATAVLQFAIGQWSKKLGIPFFVITAVVVFILGLYSWVKNSSPDTKVNAQSAAMPSGGPPLESQFIEWLKNRQDRVPGQPYPVYILAAPGGGIYAATFVASAMARLERDCPGFSQHVFAISAVSGGAIGSAIINAAEQKSAQRQRIECRDSTVAKDSDLNMELVRRVLSEDHLSPTIAATVPDTIVKLFEILLYETQRVIGYVGDLQFEPLVEVIDGRAEALETSFSWALQRACGADCGRNPLTTPFNKHWDPAGVAPALVLNTTWAETGDRIAYAPFDLEKVGDRTLKSASNLDDKLGGEVELIKAAIASARFPAVLPAMIVLRPSGQGQKVLWWNFVDGGYADASGTTTALEIYKALYARRDVIAEQAKGPVDLKLLILTDSGTDNDSPNPTGPGLVHTITPITTLLNVRELIGRRAVAHAIKELTHDPRDSSSAETGCLSKRWRVRTIVLETASLPLGWMLSQYTAARIDRFVNRPDSASGDTAQQNNATFSAIRQSFSDHCATAQHGG